MKLPPYSYLMKLDDADIKHHTGILFETIITARGHFADINYSQARSELTLYLIAQLYQRSLSIVLS